MTGSGELGLKFERKDVGGPFGGNKEPAYLALNPMGLVPVIEDDGFVLWESNAIVRYLAEKHGRGSLWPEDRRVRADADRWMDWQQTAVAPAIVTMFYGLVRTAPEKRDLAAIEISRQNTGECLAILDQAMKGRRYIAGEVFTMGDIPLGIMVWRWFAFPIERPEFRNLRAWLDRLIERPAFREHVAHPLT